MDRTLEGRIYTSLKTTGPAKTRDLSLYLKAPLLDVQKVIDTGLKDRYLGTFPSGTVYILRPMDSPGPVSSTDLQDLALPTLTNEPTVKKFLTPLYLHLPRFDQGQPPSCVGHALATLGMISYMRVTGDLPSPEAAVQRNLYSPDGGFYYDRFFRPVPSPWWIFSGARRNGHYSGYGARMRDGIDLLQNIGIVPWDYCYTPKTLPTKEFWPAHGNMAETWEYLKPIAALHIIPDMAQATDFLPICRIIERMGAASVELRIFSSITRMGSDGRIPDVEDPAREQEIGKHCLDLIGFDTCLGLYTYLNWWGTVARVGTISAEYVRRFGGPAVGVYDRQETPFPDEDPDPKDQHVQKGAGIMEKLKAVLK